MSFTETQQSILTKVPSECLKIIKIFNEEKKIEVPLIISNGNNNIFDRISTYKDGYHFERVSNRSHDCMILSDIYTDDKEGIVDLLMCLHFQHGDNDNDDDDFNKTIIWSFEKSLLTGYCLNTDEDKLRSFFYNCMNLVGKYYSKNI